MLRKYLDEPFRKYLLPHVGKDGLTREWASEVRQTMNQQIQYNSVLIYSLSKLTGMSRTAGQARVMNFVFGIGCMEAQNGTLDPDVRAVLGLGTRLGWMPGDDRHVKEVLQYQPQFAMVLAGQPETDRPYLETTALLMLNQVFRLAVRLNERDPELAIPVKPEADALVWMVEGETFREFTSNRAHGSKGQLLDEEQVPPQRYSWAYAKLQRETENDLLQLVGAICHQIIEADDSAQAA